MRSCISITRWLITWSAISVGSHLNIRSSFLVTWRPSIIFWTLRRRKRRNQRKLLLVSVQFALKHFRVKLQLRGIIQRFTRCKLLNVESVKKYFADLIFFFVITQNFMRWLLIQKQFILNVLLDNKTWLYYVWYNKILQNSYLCVFKFLGIKIKDLQNKMRVWWAGPPARNAMKII